MTPCLTINRHVVLQSNFSIFSKISILSNGVYYIPGNIRKSILKSPFTDSKKLYSLIFLDTANNENHRFSN